MVSLQNGAVKDIPLVDTVSKGKRVWLDGDAVLTARSIGISFGDK
jgi:hypothetical protein